MATTQYTLFLLSQWPRSDLLTMSKCVINENERSTEKHPSASLAETLISGYCYKGYLIDILTQLILTQNAFHLTTGKKKLKEKINKKLLRFL